MVINPTITFWPNGNKCLEDWFYNHNYHREDGPALICYNTTGELEEEYWFNTGFSHRIDGPAYTLYNESGEIQAEHWYLYGKKTNHKEWLIDNNLYKPYNTWTDEEKLIFVLRWL